MINYTPNLTPLSRISEVNDLNIHFNNKLKFEHHITQIVIKAVRELDFIKKRDKELERIIQQSCLTLLLFL